MPVGQLNAAYRHGHDMRGDRSPTYISWAGMKTRVSNPHRHNSHRYIGRVGLGLVVGDLRRARTAVTTINAALGRVEG